MAQTLYTIASPAIRNAVINTLPLVLWSENRANPQFRYVLDVYYKGSTERLTRVKFPNNYGDSDGAGVIDFAPIVRDFMGYDEPFYTTGSSFNQNRNSQKFTLVAGEEWATTVSGSAKMYNGNGAVGRPAYTASNNTLFLAVNEYDAAYVFSSRESYNWDDADYHERWLTNQPFTSSNDPKIVFNTDYETISTFDNLTAITVVNNVTASIFSGSALLASGSIFGGYANNDSGSLRHIGVGPENLRQLSSSFDSALRGTWTDIEIDIDFDINDKKYYFKNGDCSNYTVTRFAFINKLGVFDYYNVEYSPIQTTNVDRKTYTKVHLNYDVYGIQLGPDPPSIVGDLYNINNRGFFDYYLQPTDTFQLTTDYIDTPTAKWLTEMFESPSVFIQGKFGFEPIMITNAEYRNKTNPRGQKTFQYRIEFTLANQRNNR